MWLVYGIYRAIVGICLALFSGTATVMFGALLSRVADPFALMGDFHIIYVCIVVLTLLSGLFGLLAGLALLANRRVSTTLRQVFAKFSEFFVCWGFPQRNSAPGSPGSDDLQHGRPTVSPLLSFFKHISHFQS
jgi:hypothetical protein